MVGRGTDLQVLGPFTALVDGRPLAIGSRKQRLLLALLAVELNRAVPTERLIDSLWTEHPPATAEATLRSLVYRVRRLLADCADLQLVGGDWGYTLQGDPRLLDAARFATAVDEARERVRRCDPAQAAQLLTAALALWRGPAFVDLRDAEVLRPEALRLEQARAAAIEELADAWLDVGDPAAAQRTVEPLVAAEPLREAAWRRLMLALYRQGRQAEALETFQRVRRTLAGELGLDPGPELRALEQLILQQDPALDGHRPRVGPAVAGQRFDASGGTVAFLFTDIEASNRRWQGDPAAMSADLARHDELVRAAATSAGGSVFAHTGDGVCAAFPTASAALTAAVQAQLALGEENWRAPDPLRVRMALHAGAAERRGENWFGPTLNRTARLLEIAAGGQILCSRAFADLADDALPADVVLRTIGLRALTDLTRPEQVVVVEHPDQFQVAPVERAPVPDAASGDSLPQALTPFCGRDRELSEVGERLASTCLLTITGIGGAGKTRLALELARRSRDRYPDGVRFVELAAVTEGPAVPDTVAGALGLAAGFGGGEPIVERLRSWLAERTLLLVLDNCEQVAEDVAALLEAVLPRAAGLTVLATSREILAVAGEVTWSLPPMSLPPANPDSAAELAASDAVALFCARAAAAQPAFSLTDANAAAVARICRRLDGIPLAIELAAARVRVLGTQQLADRLDEKFAVLDGGNRRATIRHQTLRAALDWSWDLMPSAEQSALAWLAVFSAEFTLEAAETVVTAAADQVGVATGTGFDALDLITRLVEKSLLVVQPDRGAYYRLLQTVHSYASERLAESGQIASAREALCQFCLGHADAFAAAGYYHGDDSLHRITDNAAAFLDAISWCLSTGRREDAVRLTTAGCAWGIYADGVPLGPLLQRCLVEPRPAPTPALVECLAWAWLLMRDIPEFSAGDGVAMLREGVRLAGELDDRVTCARSRFFLGEALAGLGHADEARGLLVEARDGYLALGMPIAAAWASMRFAYQALAGGDLADARRWLEVAREECGSEFATFGESGRWTSVHVEAALAVLGAALGDVDLATDSAERAVGAARSMPRGVLVMALCRATESAIALDADSAARETLRELLILLREVGARRWVAPALEATLALIAPVELGAPGHAASAARILGAAQAVRRKLGELGQDVPVIAERVTSCRRAVGEVLDAGALSAELARGGRATPDEALRWARELLDGCSIAAGRL